ncbi:MAG TPA: S8 family serine peptidase [Pyrinomonadaceae bacterium]|nr:S8 family serine peptidase [Pyrinomonadaceae bacterium]
MKLQKARRSRRYVYAVIALVAMSAAVFGIWKGASTVEAQDPALARVADEVQSKHGISSDSAVSGQYIIVFREDALAGYDGKVPGYPKPAKLRNKNRLDVKDRNAVRYVQYLERQQAGHEAKINQLLGRQVEVSKRMQHALNAIVARMSSDEASMVEQMAEVYLVDPVVHVPMDTDVGPLLIGAEPLWNGTNPGQTAAVQGEGMVIGDIDSGINFGSPSFAAVDPVDGYQHINPLGAGIYLGTCAAGGVDVGRCNAKLIGGYDFVCQAPGNQCGLANIREEPGFGDTNGHGTHTASTVAGNRRDVNILNNIRRISGVAPRANIIAYDVCYTNTATGQGLCPNVSSVAAVNQAIANGIVDALNFSIGGGTSPWTDTVSLAFLNATDAGIYVATSAGNDGPGANTLGHVEPWTASTAAAQHGRAAIGYSVNITGPAPVPAGIAQISANEGTLGILHSAPISGPIKLSPGYAATPPTLDDGCNAYPAGTFTGMIAVVFRGTCSFSIKVNNASAAGALAVVVVNNAGATGLIPQVPGTTVPAFGLSQVQGDAIKAFVLANPTATGAIPFPATVFINQADQLAAFSSRGPAGNFNLIKPDMTAPGVNVLAAYAGTALTGSEQLVAQLNGTSMASPHNAGSSLLLRQLKPTWSVSEVKSALEMTATQAVTRENGITPATPHDMGGGRIRVNLAANAGLVLNETKANFQAANPASGGDTTTLNLPSMAKRACVGQCQFVRTFRSTLSSSQTWNAGLENLGGTVSPNNFTVSPGGTVTLTITIDGTSVTPDGNFKFGRLVLQPQGAPTGAAVDGDLGLPIGITVPPPVIGLNPASQNISLVAGHPGTANFSIQNNGGAQLNYNVDNTGNGKIPVYDAPSTGVTTGFRATVYSDPATAGSQAQFSADDINLVTTTSIKSIFAQGFIVSGAAIPAATTALRWSIYPDAGGLPAGNPQTNPGAALWTYSTTAAGAGVMITGGNMKLDLTAAGQSISLPAGRYWVVVNTNGTFANRWAWFGSNTGTGGGFASITISTGGTGNWAANTAFAGLSMTIEGEVPCGAPWIGATTPASGTILGGASQAVQTALTTTGMSPGNYVGAVCVASNDTVNPKVAELLRLTLTPNTPPTISEIADTSTNEDTATPAIPFTVGDTQSPAGSLTVTAVSSDQNVVADGGIVLGGSDGNRNVTITPVANANGFADITITVTDQGGLTASDTFRLTVNPVNDPPTITAATGITRQQAAGASVSQIATVADIDNDPLAVTVNGGASATVNGVTVSNIVVNANGTVNASISAACGATNASFTLRVTDPGALFAQATLNVAVTNETTPPVINPIANVIATLPNGSATSMAVTFPLPTATDNCPGVTVTTNPLSGSTFNVGTTTVNVTATDAVGNTATATFTVTVRYPFSGFTGRVSNPPAINYLAAGNMVPIGFSLGGNRGLNIFTAGSPSSTPVTCPTSEPTGIASPATLSPGLLFQNNQYQMYWVTSASWAGTCRQFSVSLNDGTTRTLNFWFFN